MSGKSPRNGSLSLRVRAEAAAWLAGLRGSRRSAELEGRFKRWLAESEANRIAWERQSEAWELAGALLPRFGPRRGSAARSRRLEKPLIPAVAAVLSAALVAVALTWLIAVRSGTVTTITGERRVAILPDGSRVTLNTDTRLVVEYGGGERRVRLDRGEALFNVKPDPSLPFVVVAGQREIRALGTAFEVRREGKDDVAVTLIEGRISIEPVSHHDRTPRAGSPPPRLEQVMVVASPGERVTFVPHHPPKLDRPALQQVIAWQSGEVVFNSTPLPDAVREMNRYSERQIRLEGAGMASLRVGGLFQAGASVQFATAAAETFGLDMREAGRDIILSRGGSPASSGNSRSSGKNGSSSSGSSASADLANPRT